MAEDQDGGLVAPNPIAVSMWTSTVLTILKALSGAGLMGATWASYTPEKVSATVTVILYGVSAVSLVASWAGSKWQHWQMDRDARTREVNAAVASAHATIRTGTSMPVTISASPTIRNPNAVLATPVLQAEVAATPLTTEKAALQPGIPV